MKRQAIDRDSKKVEDRRTKEKEVVDLMIKLYCKGHRHRAGGICQECQSLLDYANKRIDLCPFMETKTFCQNCRIHCYREDMRTRIKKVMRYSGPRMIFYHPILAIKHMIESNRGKKR